MKKINPEIERRTRPKIPRKYCRTLADYIVGIASPSLMFRGVFNGDQELMRYEHELSKYMIYKRTMTKERWKSFESAIRKERKNRECTET